MLLVRGLRQPQIWLLGFFIGIFQWTNYWDFAIYYVVGGAVLVLTLIRAHGKKIGKIFSNTVFYATVILVFSWIVILPFTLRFETMFLGIGIASATRSCTSWRFSGAFPWLWESCSLCGQ